jgi:hypothetical protein
MKLIPRKKIHTQGCGLKQDTLVYIQCASLEDNNIEVKFYLENKTDKAYVTHEVINTNELRGNVSLNTREILEADDVDNIGEIVLAATIMYIFFDFTSKSPVCKVNFSSLAKPKELPMNFESKNFFFFNKSASKPSTH